VIQKIKKFLRKNNLDGYIIPKNDNYFTEYSEINNLFKVSNFTGSAGFALIFKNKNYLFVDGRYTLQAKKQSGKNFSILEIPHKWPKDLLNIKNNRIGFDPKLFTKDTLEKYFDNKVNLFPVKFNFNNTYNKKLNTFYKLKDSITGESYYSKLKKIKKYLKTNKINYLYVSASENVNWLLNIRGKDLPNSPIANCKLIVTDKGKLYFFSNIKKTSNLKRKNFKGLKFYDEKNFFEVIAKFKYKKFSIDKNTCSVFEQQIIKSKFDIIRDIDPIYD